MNSFDLEIERRRQRLDELVRLRQELRARHIDGGELERNRLQIVAVQRELSDALVARFTSHAAAA